MPHLRIEYSTNIAGRFDPAAVLAATTDALVASGVFDPPDAIKARLMPAPHFRVGSGADHGFIHAGLALLAGRDADLLFHCCGEITDTMLESFGSLRPSLLSLGSSRRLWEDAARVPKDTVLYGNLPSKLFYSDATMPLSRVTEQSADLAARMAAGGHPFILGTECDTLHVPEHATTIRAKVDCLLARA